MRKTWVICTAFVLLLAACGSEEPTGSVAGSPTTDRPTASSPSDSPADPNGGEVAYEVWFSDDRGLRVTYRTRAETAAVGAASMEDLLAGPSDSKLSTAVPHGTRLLGLAVANGVATVDLSSEFEEGSGSYAERLRLAQVTFTLTQFPTVDEVALQIDGEPVDRFGSHGIVIDGPMQRGDFEDVAPAIVVEQPRPGQNVTSPVTIAGTANVFEATVSIRILDASGREVAREFTTATCGTGCRGDYEHRVEFDIASSQPGIIEVFEESAEDGSAINVVSVPVMLSP
ncbi:MAG: Gmad2 immunoglobulin-like domain-containing protein [Actinomycetota bacterium]